MLSLKISNMTGKQSFLEEYDQLLDVMLIAGRSGHSLDGLENVRLKMLEDEKNGEYKKREERSKRVDKHLAKLSK